MNETANKEGRVGKVVPLHHGTGGGLLFTEKLPIAPPYDRK